MSYELLGLLLTVVIQALYFAHKVGIIEKAISSLEQKQDKHNSVIERVFYLEASVKSAHNRLDDLRDL